MQGRVLIVTGSSGIGAVAARMSAAAGAQLLVATGDEISGIELQAETGCELWTGDLTQPGSADSVLAQCLARFGRVDSLFNVAGLSGRRFGDGPVHECSDDGWEITLSHNLQILFRMCRAVVGRMLEQAVDANGVRGAIVSVGSVLAHSPEPRHFANHAYAAAKGAVVSMSRSMAAYYAPHGIRVNVVAPGMVRTPASVRSQTSVELTEFLRRKQPLSAGLVEAEDVARAAMFLLSDDARGITGEVISVDGGWNVTGV